MQLDPMQADDPPPSSGGGSMGQDKEVEKLPRKYVNRIWTQEDVTAWEEADPQPLIEAKLDEPAYEKWIYGLPDDLIRNAILKGLKNDNGETEALSISPTTLRKKPQP